MVWIIAARRQAGLDARLVTEMSRMWGRWPCYECLKLEKQFESGETLLSDGEEGMETGTCQQVLIASEFNY